MFWLRNKKIIFFYALLTKFLLFIWFYGVNSDKCTCIHVSVSKYINNFPGPRIGSSPVRSIVQCLARKDGTDHFYTLKVSIA